MPIKLRYKVIFSINQKLDFSFLYSQCIFMIFLFFYISLFFNIRHKNIKNIKNKILLEEMERNEVQLR